MFEIIPNWHPAFVHFPIAFTTAAAAFIATGLLFNNASWANQSLTTGRWMLWGAAIFACIAAVFGMFAYNSVDHDEAGHLAMTIHRNWALGAVAALVLLTALDAWLRRSLAKPSYGFLMLLLVALLLVLSTAWHGGEVVFRHGLGVMSLPESEGHGHHHGAGHEHGAEHGAEYHQGAEHDHDEMPMQGKDTSDAHHDEANGEHHDDGLADSVDTRHENSAHSHAPGTPSHKD